MSDDDPEAVPAEEVGESTQPEGTPNAADPRSLRRVRNKARRQEEESAEFWRGIFATETGRREMWGILTSASTFEERFACGPNGFPQDQATWHHAGERDFGLRLYRSWLRLCPDGVLAMMTENDPAMRSTKKRR